VARLIITTNEPITGLLGPNRKAAFMGVKIAVSWKGKSVVPHDQEWGDGRRGIIYGFEHEEDAKRDAKQLAKIVPDVRIEYV